MNKSITSLQLKQTNLYDTWSESHHLSFHAKALWMEFQILFNKQYWPDSLAIDNDLLLRKLGLTSNQTNKKLLMRARKELVEAGLINYTPGNRGNDPTYTLNYFVPTNKGIVILTKEEVIDLYSEKQSVPEMSSNCPQSSTQSVPNPIPNTAHKDAENEGSKKQSVPKNGLKVDQSVPKNGLNEDQSIIRAYIYKDKDKDKYKDKGINTLSSGEEQCSDTMTDEELATAMARAFGLESGDIGVPVAEMIGNTGIPNQPTDKPEKSVKAVDVDLSTPNATEQITVTIDGETVAPKPKKRRSRKKTLGDEKNKEFMEFYNEHRGGMVRCDKMTDVRVRRLYDRVNEYGEEAVREVIVAAGRNSFYGGGSSSGWRADFSWILKPDRFTQILECQKDQPTVQADRKSWQQRADETAKWWDQAISFARGDTNDSTGYGNTGHANEGQLPEYLLEYSVE